MKARTTLLSAVAAVAIVTVAYAAVTFNPGTGTGFVGKGDVQTPFGWSNATMQAEAGNLSFKYHDQATYEIVCEKQNNRNTVTNTLDRTRSVNGSVAYDTRNNKKGQVTGINLTGYGSLVEHGSPLTCPATFTLISGPTLVSSGNGKLEVTSNTTAQNAIIWTEAGGSVLP